MLDQKIIYLLNDQVNKEFFPLTCIWTSPIIMKTKA